MLNSLLMVVLFLHINITWIAKGKKSVKRQCGFIILSSSNFSIPNTKMFKRSILFMITILCLFITSTTMRIRNTGTSLKTHLDLSIGGWINCENDCEDHRLSVREGHHQCPKNADNQVFYQFGKKSGFLVII